MSSLAKLGLGLVAAGVVVAVLRRHAVADRELVGEVEAVKRDVDALHGLAADEAVVYLRGYIDGRSGRSGQGRDPVA